MNEIKLKAKDGYELTIHSFEVENPKGYVQIIHGMEEHQERYEPFIEKLNKAGYTCVSSDIRGHGKNAPVLGFFADKKGYEQLIEDQKIITSWIMFNFACDKVNIFAHSMGTIITRNLLQTESGKYKKVILSGHPNPQPFSGFGIFLSRMIINMKGPKYDSKFLANASVGKFNKKIENPKTNLDWLSVNEENVKNYMNDKYCGHGFKASAYNDLFHLVKYMGDSSRYINVNSSLPILMLRGAEDPCTGYDKGTKKSYKVLQNAGFNNITVHKYFNARHEILNEICFDNVCLDVIDFLNTGKIHNPSGI